MQAQLSDASLFQERFELKSREYDELMAQLDAESKKLFDMEDKNMKLEDSLAQEKEESTELQHVIS